MTNSLFKLRVSTSEYGVSTNQLGKVSTVRPPHKGGYRTNHTTPFGKVRRAEDCGWVRSNAIQRTHSYSPMDTSNVQPQYLPMPNDLMNTVPSVSTEGVYCG